MSAHRLDVHVAKGLADGLFISSAACSGDLWAVIMDAGNGFTEQQYIITEGTLMPKNWIMEQWDKGLYITALAGILLERYLSLLMKVTRASTSANST